MIGVEEAKRIMMAHVPPFVKGRVRLAGDAHERFVAEDVHAPCDHPLFDMSAVDGYAFVFADGTNERRIVGVVAAGEVFPRTLEQGECVRILTGAMLPHGADTVVMQEKVILGDERIRINDHALRKGGNVRRQGEQARKGDRILPQGSRLTPAACGLLSSFGIHAAVAGERPHVGVLVTGNEFDPPGDSVAGKIHGSNDVMLGAALEAMHVNWWTATVVDDRYKLAAALQDQGSADVVITTGGASVGDHDLVERALLDLGASVHFHGVAQKPGKPMLFATLHGKPVFGLPGNPRAVMVLFWEYVLPFLRAMQGAKDPWLKSDRLPMAHAAGVKGDRAEFRAAHVTGGKVTLLADEGSHMLRSLIDADALAYLPTGQRTWAIGDPMEVHYLP